MFPDLTHRRRQAEWMDEPDADPSELARSLRFIRRINCLLGYNRAMLWHLDRFAKHWKRGERITMIDIATGSADVPRAILRWADRRGFDVQIVGLDLHAGTLAAAAGRSVGSSGESPGGNSSNAVKARCEFSGLDRRLTLVRGDALNPPFAEGSFDYAITSMFLHHLDDDAIVQVLSAMGRVARRGVIAADLLRDRRAYAWISLFTLFASPMVRHDARASVGQALVKEEVLQMRDRAGLNFAEYFRHFGHRFVLAGERERTESR